MDSQMESWRQIHIAEMPYEVSPSGKIRRRSIASEAVRKIHPHRSYKPRPVRPVSNNGYLYVTLTIKGQRKRMSLHAIMLETFVGPRPAGAYGCHNNGNKRDNRIENLRWDSPKSNQADRVRHGNGQNGEANGSFKLTDSQVRQVLAMRRRGMIYRKIAARFGVSKANIHCICTGKTRKNQA